MKQIILFALFTMCTSLQAQTIREHTNALTTSITITNEDEIINTGDPILIQRSEGHFNSEYSQDINRTWETSTSYGYGYGYTSWHLEFVGTKDIRTTEKKYRLSLINGADQIIGIIRIDRKEIDIISGLVKPPFFYSVDLKAVPMLLLEQTARLDINPY